MNFCSFLLIDLITRNVHNAEKVLSCTALRNEKHVQLMPNLNYLHLPTFLLQEQLI